MAIANQISIHFNLRKIYLVKKATAIAKAFSSLKTRLHHIQLIQEEKACYRSKTCRNLKLYMLDNKLRRKILSIIKKKCPIKAEEIRKIINQNLTKKYTLANIIKHLSLLNRNGFIYKDKRYYKIKINRVMINLSISWFDKE